MLQGERSDLLEGLICDFYQIINRKNDNVLDSLE